MPKLEHANLVLDDIEPTLAFLRAAFPEWRVRGEGKSDWYGKPRRWLHFGDDQTYVTLNDNGEGPPRDLKEHAQGLAHLGFEVTDLDDIIARLSDAGFKPSIVGADHPFRRNFYFIDSAGLEFEFTEYSSEVDAERNRYD